MVVMLGGALSSCAWTGASSSGNPVRILSVSTGRLVLLEQTRSPVLVATGARKGYGKGRLQAGVTLPEGMTIELPGVQHLMILSMTDGSRAFVCRGSEEMLVRCSWGEQWPVGELRRNATSMTVSVPAEVVQVPASWTLEWVTADERK